MGLIGNHCSSGHPAILLICMGFLQLCGLSEANTIGGNVTDHLALLAIKSQIQDPLGVTRSWNNSVGMCQWTGVTCSNRHQRVTQLNLSYYNLGDTLSPSIGNLSFLRTIDLQNNNLNGEIPWEVGRLFRLRTLILSNNSIGGTIPVNLSHCSKLIYFNAGRNNLTGEIPEQLGYLPNLELLSIFRNHLTGGLPASVGNLSNLRKISLAENNLRGKIPDTLGQLTSLVFLGLSANYFSGAVPPSIYNISSLQFFLVDSNQLQGSLPRNVGFTLPNLKTLIIAQNNFNGTIPVSLSNASKMEQFEISLNSFTGKVPIIFNGFNNLWWLNVGNNSLGSGKAGDLEFLSSLSNCSMLDTIGVHMNQFGGPFPNSLANLSITLKTIVMGTNQISGTIHPGIGNLINLEILDMEFNQLAGTIPQSISKLTKLQKLSLNANNFSGTIPISLGNLTRLSNAYLESNNLQGTIPPSLGQCQSLLELSLGRNRLSGSLPKQILNITSLSIGLGLSDNLLTGSLPQEIGNLKNLVSMDISGNQFTGEIPDLGSCTSLEYLNLARNSFDGSIPQSLGSLKSITELDLSDNNLSGPIPKYFESLLLLKLLNLSYNHFEGEIPTQGVFKHATAVSLIGNEKLCGGLAELHLPPCQLRGSKKSKKSFPLKLILIVCGIVGSILMLSCLLLYWLKNNRKRGPSSSASFSINPFLKLSYQQLLKATDGFSSTNFLGEGSFGRVYKGILNDDHDSNIVAVKVVNLQYQGASKSFMAECETLRNIRHRNLVKIISACSSIDFQGNSFKALVYEFMPYGNLDKWLHELPKSNGGKGEPRGLSFLQRISIAIDVASALDYLHHQCQVPIVHCDLKPSNVLLDNDMVAHLGDFGLAKFLPKANNSISANQTSSLGLKGTVGYAAPEYAMGSKANTKGDVYSYGILLLEMFTSKRPTDDMFKDGLNIHDFTKMVLPEQVIQIADPLLVREASADDDAITIRNPSKLCMDRNKMQEFLVSILQTGVACSIESPRDRMEIIDAAKVLQSIKNQLVGNRIHATI